MSLDYRNLDDVAAQLRAAGLMLDTVKNGQGGTLVGEVYVESVRSVRCDVSGEKKRQTGSYRLHELRLSDGIWIAGAYWVDHGNTSFKIELNKECAKCGAVMPLREKACPSCGSTKRPKVREIPKEQIEAHKKRMEENRRQAAADAKIAADRAAAWANAVWLKCREAEQPEDAGDYIARKKLRCGHGTRILDSNDGIVLEGADKDDYAYLAVFHGARVVPMCDEQGRRRGLQFILSRTRHKELIARREGRDKEYWPRGMTNEGLHYIIGGSMHRVGIVAEGFATGASLYEATNIPVAVAFVANGLGKTGERVWKAKKKRINLLYAADDDWLQRCVRCGKYTTVETATCTHCAEPHGKSNAGVTWSRDAALATSGAWLAPVFSAPRPADRKGDTDFNDLRVAEGEQPVRAQIEAKLAELGWGANPPPRGSGVVPGEGAGERAPMPSIIGCDEALERYVFIYGGKGTLFDAVEHILVPKVDVVEMLPKDGWNEMRARKRVARLDEVGFDPAATDARIKCNLWGGWPTRPRAGRCESLLELFEYLCSGEGNAEEVYEWGLKWLAYPIQHPGAKMRTALVLHGSQGTGKNLFFESVMAIYGDYGRIIDQSAIEDKFNDWASRKLFLIADEVVARQELFHTKNKLKGIITGEWIRINPKNVAAHDERNHVNLVFLSNEPQPLVLERDDRRYAVIRTPEKLSPRFYTDVKAELADGGVAALHDHLLNLDLGDFGEHTPPPMTDAKAALIDRSMDSVMRFLRDWQAGDVVHRGEDVLPFCPCPSAALYRIYLEWCRRMGESRPRPENQFAGDIGALPGWFKGHKNRRKSFHTTETVRQRFVIPSDKAIAESVPPPPPADSYECGPSESRTEWLTRCFFAFQGAIGDLS